MERLSIDDYTKLSSGEDAIKSVREQIARRFLEFDKPKLPSLPIYSPYTPFASTYQDPLESQQETISKGLTLAREQKEGWLNELFGTTLYNEARTAARYHLQNLASRERAQKRLRDMALQVAGQSMDDTYIERTELIRQQHNFAQERRSYERELQEKEQKIRDLEQPVEEKLETCPFGRADTLQVRIERKGRAHIKYTQCALAEAININGDTMMKEEILARSKILEDFGCPLATFQERDINRPILLKRGFFRDQYLNLPYKEFQFNCQYATGERKSNIQID